MGIQLIIYLDDILILHQVKEELVQITPLICQMLEALGLVVNQKKSVLIPQQKMEFLGFLVDATTLHLIFPVEKLRKIQQLAQQLLRQQTVSVRDLARFVGKTSASQRAIWQAPSFQGATVFDKFCGANRSISTRWLRDEIQCHPETHQGGRDGSDLVEPPSRVGQYFN